MNKYPQRHEVGRRRAEILRVIRQQQVSSQEELQKLLERAGFPATQPTLSRDLRDLGIAKTPTGYVAPQPEGAAPVLTFTPPERREYQLDQAIEEFAVSIERAGTLIVIKTPPAAAQPLAHAVDAAALDQILGTIAGDDTVFIALRTARAAVALVRRLRENIAHKPGARRAGA